jgi:hypothetical protein
MSTFKPTVRRISIRRGGRIDSEKLSTFFDQVVDDMLVTAENTTDLSLQITDQAKASHDSDRDLRQRIEQLRQEIEAMRTRDAEDNLNLVYHISMHDSTKFQFLSNSTYATRVAVDTLLGEATVPINAAEPRFFQMSINTGDVIPIEDLSITVTGTFDAGDEQGLINHESGGTVKAGSPARAFNGNNISRWIREVSYDLYSDVTEVMCELTVDLPAGSGGESNVVYIVPAPAGDVDITGVYISPDLGNSFTLVPNFTAVYGSGPKRWIFPVKQVQRLKIRLRQKNWIEEDGKKVFRYGAQEIGLQLLEWDKVYSSSNPINQNHTVVLKQDAPDGYGFNKLSSLSTFPMYTLEDVGARHIHIKASTDEDGTDIIWDSDLDARPQDTSGFDPSEPIETIYFIVTLNYVQTSGGSSSPFFVGTTPVFTGLSFQANVEAL